MEAEIIPPESTSQVSDGSARRLANLKPFQRGVSGNPGGKPKGEDVRALARKNTKRAMERIVQLIEDDDPRVALMAAKEVLDRAYGKPKVADDDNAADKKSVTINILRYTDATKTDADSGASKTAVQIRSFSGQTVLDRAAS